jgi:hypothetical protein
MKKLVGGIGIAFCVLAISGCETTTSNPYTASTENVLKFQSILKDSDQKVALGSFTENGEIGSLTCRLSGPVDVSPGKTRAAYIKEAMQTELFMAQVYAVDADVEISGHVDSLKFSSISPASWEIGFTVSSNKSPGYSVITNYPFKTSYSAYSACKNVADAFGPAVQQMIRDVVSHPQFAALVGQ